MSTSQLSRLLPFLKWFHGYTSSSLKTDFISGLTVALVLVPQSMAYAQLAGLPPYYGLYASLLPPVIAVMFGSSSQLATGPVAVVSLMTSAALAPLATAGSSEYIAYAILLALVAGLFQFVLGLLRLGLLVNFLSHPVVNGFTNAAALVIATSQLSQLLGVSVSKGKHHYETILKVVAAANDHIHWPTLWLALIAIVVMVTLNWVNPRIPYVLIAVTAGTLISWAIGFEKNRVIQLTQIMSPKAVQEVRNYNEVLAEIDRFMAVRVVLTNSIKKMERSDQIGGHVLIEANAELAKLMVNIEMSRERSSILRDQIRDYWFVAVRLPGQPLRFYPPGEIPQGLEPLEGEWRLNVGDASLDETSLTMVGGARVVGTIPQGLPGMSFPRFDYNIAIDLLPMAIVISVLGFMEAISIAKRMSAATGQRLDPNQELIGQGLANMVGSLFQSYPVSGSFSRSAINFQAGAATGLAMVFSSMVVLVTLMLLTPLLYYLPLSVLAAVIMMAVFNLINIRGFIHAWKAQKYDGIISVMTFACTFGFAPHLEVGLLAGVILSTTLLLYRTMRPNWWLLSRGPDGTYRRADRWNLETCRHVAVLAFNRSIIFANVNHLEEALEKIVRTMPGLMHVLIVGYAISELDASGEVTLSILVSRLRTSGYDISFCGLNDHVLHVMQSTGLYEKIGEDHFHSNIAQAVQSIHRGSCLRSGARCPLIEPQLGLLTKEQGEGLEERPDS